MEFLLQRGNLDIGVRMEGMTSIGDIWNCPIVDKYLFGECRGSMYTGAPDQMAVNAVWEKT